MSMEMTTLPLATARRSLLVALLLPLFLTACGGGGGDNEAAPVEPVIADTPAPPANQAPLPPPTAPDDPDPQPPAVDSEPSAPVQGPSLPDNDVPPPAPAPVDDSAPPATDAPPVVVGGDSGLAPTVPVTGDNGDSGNLDGLFGDDAEGSGSVDEVVVELEDPTVINDEGASDSDTDTVSPPEQDLSAETPSPPVDEPDLIDEPVNDGELATETPPATTPGDLDGLFGDGTESAAPEEQQSHSSSRELRWELPSQRVDGTQLSRQEVKSIELWGGRSEQQLQRWATLPPATQSYSLAETPSGLYRFTLVTVDQDGLRSDPSAPVIRDLR